MKKLFFLIAMCSTLTFIACKKDKEEETPSEYMTASIDGNAFEATTFANSVIYETLLSTGTNEDGTFIIGLNIPLDIPVNEPQTIDEFDFGISFTDADDNAFYTVGTVELTLNDDTEKEMEGTFSFTATQDGDDTNVYEITNGAFKFTY